MNFGINGHPSFRIGNPNFSQGFTLSRVKVLRVGGDLIRAGWNDSLPAETVRVASDWGRFRRLLQHYVVIRLPPPHSDKWFGCAYAS
jgi:hypothetical protein